MEVFTFHWEQNSFWISKMQCTFLDDFCRRKCAFRCTNNRKFKNMWLFAWFLVAVLFKSFAKEYFIAWLLMDRLFWSLHGDNTNLLILMHPNKIVICDWSNGCLLAFDKNQKHNFEQNSVSKYKFTNNFSSRVFEKTTCCNVWLSSTLEWKNNCSICEAVPSACRTA